MGRYWSVTTKDMRPIQSGHIKYRVRKIPNTDRWELTIRRKMNGCVGMSDIVIHCITWAGAAGYASEHWVRLKDNGDV